MSKTYLRCCQKTVEGLYIECPECGTDLIKFSGIDKKYGGSMKDTETQMKNIDSGRRQTSLNSPSDKRGEPIGLDEAVQMFAAYIRGENGFDELDFKDWLIDWRDQKIAEAKEEGLRIGVKAGWQASGEGYNHEYAGHSSTNPDDVEQEIFNEALSALRTNQEQPNEEEVMNQDCGDV